MNELLKQIAEEIQTKHHFITAYFPWANRTVERVCREPLRVCQALCSEWKLAVQDWPSVHKTIQGTLNSTPLRPLGKINLRNGWRCPLEVFTGHYQRRALMRALPPTVYKTAKSVTKITCLQHHLVNELQNSVNDMH